MPSRPLARNLRAAALPCNPRLRVPLHGVLVIPAATATAEHDHWFTGFTQARGGTRSCHWLCLPPLALRTDQRKGPVLGGAPRARLKYAVVVVVLLVSVIVISVIVIVIVIVVTVAPRRDNRAVRDNLPGVSPPIRHPLLSSFILSAYAYLLPLVSTISVIKNGILLCQFLSLSLSFSLSPVSLYLSFLVGSFDAGRSRCVLLSAIHQHLTFSANGSQLAPNALSGDIYRQQSVFEDSHWIIY